MNKKEVLKNFKYKVEYELKTTLEIFSLLQSKEQYLSELKSFYIESEKYGNEKIDDESLKKGYFQVLNKIVKTEIKRVENNQLTQDEKNYYKMWKDMAKKRKEEYYNESTHTRN